MAQREIAITGWRLYLVLLIIIYNSLYAYGNCVGVSSRMCLTDLTEDETNQTLSYVLSKYEEVERKITGEPIGVRGKRITEGEKEDLIVAFQYIDNTPADILQTCAFIVHRQPGQCETISTVCNSFLPRPPRPLLQRDDLTVCDDDDDQQQQKRDQEERRAQDTEHEQVTETTTNIADNPEV